MGKPVQMRLWPAPTKPKGGRRQYEHLLARIIGTPIAILPRKLEAILAAIGPRLGLDIAHLDAGPMPLAPEERDALQMVNGIAVIDVFGSLVHRGGFMDAMSGLTSYEQLSAELATAVRDSSVRGILLRIDSPGGEVSGAFDLAAAVAAANKVKPVVAIAEDMACSAAYLLGCAAGKFFATQSAVVGSIGVVLAHVDTTQADRALGVKVTQFHAGARKVDLSPHSELDGASIAAIQGHVDAFYNLFVEAVAENRGLSRDAVRATEAGVYIGADAASTGLVDAVGTYADAMEAALPDEEEVTQPGMRLSVEAWRQPASKATNAFTIIGNLDPADVEALANQLGISSDRITTNLARHGTSGDTLTTPKPKAPVGPYDTFEECVSANQDKDDPEAFCGWMEKQAEGSAEASSPAATVPPGTQQEVRMDPTKLSPGNGASELVAIKETLAKLEGENTSLKAELAAKTAAIAQVDAMRKEDVIQKHLKEGRLVPSTVDAWREVAAHKTAEALDATLATLPVIIHKTPAGHAGDVSAATPSPASPLEQLRAKASQIQAAEPTLTPAAAFEKACFANPNLYREHRQQHMSAARK